MTEAVSMRDDFRNDLLTGASEIAEYLGWSKRRVYHASRTGHLPMTHAGALLVARKSELSRALSALSESAAA